MYLKVLDAAQGEETRNGYMAAERQPVDNFRLKSTFLSRFD